MKPSDRRTATAGPPELAGFASVPDYIYGITREIWEDRGVGASLARYYAPDVIVRSPTGITQGNAGVVAQTLQTLHQFPDRELVGEDVIFTSGSDATFLSSHRLISVMTHLGDGELGAATARTVRSRIIADCWVVHGQVKEEWLVRDQAAFANCLGTNAQAMALSQVTEELAAKRPATTFSPGIDLESRYRADLPQDPAFEGLRAALERVWTGKTLSAVRDMYALGATVHIPGGGSVHGHADIDRFIIGYLASFPDCRFRIHNAIVMREPERAVRIAVRWSLEGTHGGYGHFGPPTGAPIYVMGLSHLWLTGGVIQLEWLLTDEVSVWKQIHRHRLTHAQG